MCTVAPVGKTRVGWTGLLASVLALALVACAARQLRAPGPPWESGVDLAHPLAGRIWDVAAERFIPPDRLVARAAAARFVLLGEQHDNPDHHRLQAWVLRALIAADRRPAVAFEMFDLDEAPALARYVAAHPADAGGLGDAVGWSRSGWPPWAWYRPIAEAALAAGLPLVAANLDRETTRVLVERGIPALDPIQAARLGLDRPLAPAVRAAMAAEIRASHCDTPLSDALLDGMIAVQRARDATMAERLAAAAGPGGGVLIAGLGHVRADRGVPVALAQLAPGSPTFPVAFLQVRRDATRPEAYAAEFSSGRLPVDAVWFTPRVDDLDPCETFRAPLERLRQRGRTD
jgi:uncharacterized iron-regulated protein